MPCDTRTGRTRARRPARPSATAWPTPYTFDSIGKDDPGKFQAVPASADVTFSNVAYTALALAKEHGLSAEQRAFLVRCALLHDVGRRRGDLDILGKVFAVLMMHYLPSASARLMERPGRLGHALYVYRHHPAIGAALLRKIGMEEEAAVIERHHMAAAPGDSTVLVLLREADARN